MSKKLFTKVVSLSLTAAMVLSMAPVNASAAKEVKPKSMKASKSSKIKVGQTKTITASRKSKKSTNDVKYVNFKPAKTKNIGIGVKTSDDTIVSVEKVSNGKYTYTGVNTGTATLTITSRAKTAKGKKLQAKLDVTVINPFKVTQTGAYTFTMSTADKLEKVDKRDVKVTQEGNTVDNAVKSVKLSEDKMSVEVTMEIPFVDQQKYNVEFGKEKDSFVASVGAPAAINIKTQSVVINKPTAVEYAVVDAKGMDVTNVIDAAKLSVDVTVKTGYYDGKKLTMWKVGDTAEVKVVYHTWTYDQTTGKENVIEGKGTITAVDKSAVTVTGLDKWTIADRVLSWDTDEMRTVVPKGDNTSKIWVRMKKSDGTYVNNKDNAADFSFDPINTSVLYVNAKGEVYANREGVEYAKVTYFDGAVKYQYTLPVTVGAEAKATSIMINPGYVVVSKNAMKPTPITAIVKDQYGNAMDRSTDFKAEKLSGNDVATLALAGTQPVDKTITKIDVTATGTEGTGIYKVTLVGLTTTVTVSSRDVSSAAADYRMIVKGSNELDVSLYEGLTNDEIDVKLDGVHFDFFKTKAGLIDDIANTAVHAGFKAIYINGVKFDDLNKLPNYITFDNTGIDFKPLVTDVNNYIITAKAGSYNIKVDAKIGGKDVSMTNYVVLKDTTKAPTSDSYGINKLDNDLTLPNTVTDLAKVIIKNKVNNETLANPEKYIRVINRNGEVTGGINLNDGQTYYVDRAAVPSFEAMIAGVKKTVWLVTDALVNKQIEVVKEFDYKVTNVDVASTTSIVLTFNKNIAAADNAKFEAHANYKVTAINLFTNADAGANAPTAAVVAANKVTLTVPALDQKNLKVTVQGQTDLSFAAASGEKDLRQVAVAPTVSGAPTVDEHNMTITMDKPVKFWKEHTLKDSGANVFTLVTPTADTENTEVKLTTTGTIVDGATTGDIFVKLDATDTHKAGYYRLHTMTVGGTHTTLTNPTVTTETP